MRGGLKLVTARNHISHPRRLCMRRGLEESYSKQPLVSFLNVMVAWRGES